jgi:hypothetical protein
MKRSIMWNVRPVGVIHSDIPFSGQLRYGISALRILSWFHRHVMIQIQGRTLPRVAWLFSAFGSFSPVWQYLRTVDTVTSMPIRPRKGRVLVGFTILLDESIGISKSFGVRTSGYMARSIVFVVKS